jgi:LmbE family N-acetylglucosaminyl deacetylase
LTALRQLLLEAPLLLLSPHFDDAALSCAALLGRDRPVDVLTVLAGCPEPPRQGAWDRVTGFADSGQSLRARRAEEEEAFAGTPHRLASLGLLEAEYLAGPRSRADAEPVAAAVSTWLEGNPGGIVALPAGAGTRPGRLRPRFRRLLGRAVRLAHPDHLFVRDAALDVAVSRADARAVLYEELPYAWGGAAAGEVRRLARRRHLTPECVLLPVDRRAKAARIAVYASQVPHLSARGRRVDVAGDLPGEERYWILGLRSR